MKLWKLFLFAIVVCSFAACEDDEDMPIVCTQTDWVGSYTGMVDCGSGAEDATVTITASGADQIVIRYATATVTTTFDPVPFDGCMLSRSVTSGGATGSVDATLEGDNITINELAMGGGFDIDCTVTATRN